MPRKPKILAFAGSSREGSHNKKLVRVAAQGAQEAGAEATLIDLKDLPMPLFTLDLEKTAGMHPNAAEFKKLLRQHDGFLLSSPEHNSSLPAELKNALDWASRKEDEDEPPLAAYDGKFAAIMAASPGGLGGLRALVHLRALLQNIKVTVLPNQHALSEAHKAFDEAGNLKDEDLEKRVKGLGRSLAELLKKIVT